MVHVDLLGVVRITRDGKDVLALENHPKKLTLLAYLAIQPPERFVTRDALLGVFWPDSDERQARHALSQSLHQLRRVLDDDVVLAKGPQRLALNASVITVDVRRFETAIAARNWQLGFDMYRGDLLADFNFFDVEIAEWLERERARLRKLGANAAWQVASDHLGICALDDSVAAATQALQLGGVDESNCAQYVRRALGSGYGVVAQKIAQAFTDQMNASIGEAPSPSFQELYYQSNMAASAQSQVNVTVVIEETDLHQKGRSVSAVDHRARVGGRWVRIALYALVALPVFILGRTLATREARASGTPPVTSTIALPPLDVDGPQAARVETRLVDALVTEIGTTKHLRIMVLDSVAQLRRRNGVDYWFQGRVADDDNGVLVAYRLIDSRSKLIRASGAVRLVESDNVDSVAVSLANRIREAAARETRVRHLSETDKLGWNRAQAVHTLADSLREVGALSESERLYALADSIYSAVRWTTDGQVLAGIARLNALNASAMIAGIQGDPAEATRRLEFAGRTADQLVAAFPNRYEILEARGILSYRSWMVRPSPARATLDQAEADLRAAIRQYPESASSMVALSGVLFAKGDYMASRVMAKRALEVDSFLENDEEILVRLFLTSFNLHDDIAAKTFCDELEHRFPRRWQGAACRLLIMGWSDVVSADPEVAWDLVNDGLAGEGVVMRQQIRPRLKALAAAVIARAGDVDSARAVLAALPETADSEMIGLKAAAYLRLGDAKVAHRLGEQYRRASPSGEIAVSYGRLFEGYLGRPIVVAPRPKP
jgi:DNA-binding SARP family transcriptional activator